MLILKESSIAYAVLKLLRKHKEMHISDITSKIDRNKKAIMSALLDYSKPGEFQLWHVSGYLPHPSSGVPCRVYKIGPGVNASKDAFVKPSVDRPKKQKIKPVLTLLQLLEVMNEAYQNQQQCSA